jgi:hypothetical protein
MLTSKRPSLSIFGFNELGGINILATPLGESLFCSKSNQRRKIASKVSKQLKEKIDAASHGY